MGHYQPICVDKIKTQGMEASATSKSQKETDIRVTVACSLLHTEINSKDIHCQPFENELTPSWLGKQII